MARDEELLKLTSQYVKELAQVSYSGDFHARYSHESQDEIAEGIRTFYDAAGTLFAASKA